MSFLGLNAFVCIVKFFPVEELKTWVGLLLKEFPESDTDLTLIGWDVKVNNYVFTEVMFCLSIAYCLSICK
jgi:hypothetical protein